MISRGFGRVSELLRADGGVAEQGPEALLLSSMLPRATAAPEHEHEHEHEHEGGTDAAGSIVTPRTNSDGSTPRPRKRPSLVPATDTEATALAKDPKDPNAPKRPLNAFFLYLREERPRAKLAHPEMAANDLVRLLTQQWDAEAREVRARYEAAAESARSQYHHDKTKYDSHRSQERAGALAVGLDAAATADAETLAVHEAPLPVVQAAKKKKKRPAPEPFTPAPVLEPLSPAPVLSSPASSHPHSLPGTVALDEAAAAPTPADTPLKKKKKNKHVDAAAPAEPASPVAPA